MHQIVTDPEARTITVGSEIFSKPDLIRRREADFSIKYQICNGPDNVHRWKELHKFYATVLGPRFNFRFYAANYWLWLGNHMTVRTSNMLRFEGHHWRHYDANLVESAHKVLPYIKAAERNDEYNIIPILLAYEACPDLIESKIGPIAWGRVIKNSISRNLRIMHAMRRCKGDIEFFTRLLDTPSWAIYHIGRAPRRTRDLIGYSQFVFEGKPVHLLTHCITDVKSARAVSKLLRSKRLLKKGDPYYILHVPRVARDLIDKDMETSPDTTQGDVFRIPPYERTYRANGGPVIDGVMFTATEDG